jgi:hypothetical protein
MQPVSITGLVAACRLAGVRSERSRMRSDAEPQANGGQGRP